MSKLIYLLLIVAIASFITPHTFASIFNQVDYDVNLSINSDNISISEKATDDIGSPTQVNFTENLQASEPVSGSSVSIDFDSKLEGSSLTVTADAAIQISPLADSLESIHVQGLARYFFTLDGPTSVELIAEIRSLDPDAPSLSQPGFAWSRLQIRRVAETPSTIYNSPDRTDGQTVFINEQFDLSAGDYFYQVDLFGSPLGTEGPELFSESRLNIVPEPGLSGALLFTIIAASRRRR